MGETREEKGSSRPHYPLVSSAYDFNSLPATIRFLFLAPALSLLPTLMWTLKFSRNKDSRLLSVAVVFFLSKSPGGHAILPPKRAGARNSKFHFSLHEGADVRTITSNQNFLVAPLRALRARENSANILLPLWTPAWEAIVVLACNSKSLTPEVNNLVRW